MTGIGILALLNAAFTMFGASMYLGTMWVIRLFLQPSWTSLTVKNVALHFGIPITHATRFFRLLFVPLTLSGALMIWSGWGSPGAVACAVVAFASYGALALWFQVRILPVNTRILSGDVDSESELQGLLVRWNDLNQLRFYASTVYWLAALAFFLGYSWEALS